MSSPTLSLSGNYSSSLTINVHVFQEQFKYSVITLNALGLYGLQLDTLDSL